MSALAGRTVQLIIYSFCILCLTFGCAEIPQLYCTWRGYRWHLTVPDLSQW